MNLVFSDNKLISLEQKPVEKEFLRTDIFDIKKTKDPLTSFLQIIRGEKSSLVLDGRRLYTMNVVNNTNANQVIIEVAEYFNLWADHKRSKFEKIIFEKNNEGLLPSKILIYFDKRIFSLE